MTAPLTEVVVDLDPYADNTGITTADRTAAGSFNIWGNSYPAEQLPAAGPVRVDGIAFRFPPAAPGRPDNVRCAGQLIEVPPGRYDWIQLLAAAERRTEDPLWLHYADGATDQEWLRISDFWPETAARFGETAAYQCGHLHYPRHVDRKFGPSIWRQRVPVPRGTELRAVRLPDNPAIHLFAMTLVEEAR